MIFVGKIFMLSSLTTKITKIFRHENYPLYSTIHLNIRHRPILPYLSQGKIACANVLSDLYAMGVTECDNMLMLLGVSEKLTQRERDIVTPLVIKGFNGACVLVGQGCHQAI